MLRKEINPSQEPISFAEHFYLLSINRPQKVYAIVMQLANDTGEIGG